MSITKNYALTMRWSSIFTLPRVAVSVRNALMVFIVLYNKLNNQIDAVACSIPVASISFCIFILNDINDIEKDKINHPNRALPSGAISIRMAVVIYFLLLIFNLFYIHAIIDISWQYFFYIFIIIGISYSYIVNALPFLKNIYVGLTFVFLYYMIFKIGAFERNYLHISVAIFLYVFSMELLEDIEDMRGDDKTLIKYLPPKNLAVAPFLILYTSEIPLFLFSNSIGSYTEFFFISIANISGNIIYYKNKTLAKKILLLPAVGILLYLI